MPGKSAVHCQHPTISARFQSRSSSPPILLRRRTRSPANKRKPLPIRKAVAMTGDPNKPRNDFSKAKPTMTAGTVAKTIDQINAERPLISYGPADRSSQGRGLSSLARNKEATPPLCRRVGRLGKAKNLANAGLYPTRAGGEGSPRDQGY